MPGLPGDHAGERGQAEQEEATDVGGWVSATEFFERRDREPPRSHREVEDLMRPTHRGSGKMRVVRGAE